MTETYFRVHWADTPDFNADNAWSGLWGSKWSTDGRQTRCHDCAGTGNYFGEQCKTCDGDGWEDALYGYSCCDSAEDLAAYFAEAGEPGDEGGRVIVFEGRRVGTGFDGEPLAVPTSIVEEMTWSEFKKRYTA
ncbi:hypothetical protein [Nonomuraea pusilla]|uniref:Uncharacterized protein n=1 Tax=Nonomuraea pusilla TaxID=46177 RepID=A0A1H8K2M2_9ACTN|nr:hypothetical protein [Nonomuraea pusilla]SEN87220.1 hypothetical protein SAMN05660976_08510 [Nonomuraea pusilla]